MKLRKNKKGFTIVELVIVIAVIGVLAAVLVPTFVNLTQKANEAADQSLVKNLNTSLQMEEQAEKPIAKPTLHGAVLALDEYGYSLDNLLTKSGEKLLWNQKTNRFLLEKDISNEENASKTIEFWRIQNDYTPGTDKYSVYAGKNFKYSAEQADLQKLDVGFDAGYHTDIEAIKYDRKVATQGQEVNIRTNGFSTAFDIDAPLDTINHYGEAGSVNISEIKPSSYHENGAVPFLAVKKGRIVLESNSAVSTLYLSKTDSAFADISVKLEGQANLPEVKRDSIGTDIGTDLVKICKIEYKDSQETIYLKGNGTIKDAQVYVSTTGNKEDATQVTEASASSATKQVANAKVGDEVEDAGLASDPMNVSTVNDFVALCGSLSKNNGYVAPKTNFIKLGADLDLSEVQKNESGLNAANMLAVGSIDLNGHTLKVTNFSVSVRIDGSTISNGTFEVIKKDMWKPAGNGGTDEGYGSYVLGIGANNVTVENISTIGGISVGESASDLGNELVHGANNCVFNNCNIKATRYYGFITQSGSSATMNGGSVVRFANSTCVADGKTLVYSGTPTDWGVGTNVIKFVNVKVDRENPFGVKYGAGTTITKIDNNNWLLNGQSAAVVA